MNDCTIMCMYYFPSSSVIGSARWFAVAVVPKSCLLSLVVCRLRLIGARPWLQVYVASVGPGLLEERMRLGRMLWSSDISAEYSTADNPKLKKQLDEVSCDQSARKIL